MVVIASFIQLLLLVALEELTAKLQVSLEAADLEGVHPKLSPMQEERVLLAKDLMVEMVQMFGTHYIPGQEAEVEPVKKVK
jgi:hypothetical protein